MRDKNREHDTLSFKTWLVNLFEDERQQTSMKPVIALFSSLVLCGVMIANIINSAFVPASYLVDAVMIITAIGMGSDSIDKFSLRGRHNAYLNEYDDSGNFSSQSYTHTETTNSSDNNIGQSSNELL